MTTLEKIGQVISVALLIIVGFPAFLLYGICIGIRDLIDFAKHCYNKK
jgi:hypothetical protein